MLQPPLRTVARYLDALHDLAASRPLISLLEADLSLGQPLHLEASDYQALRQQASALGSPQRLLDLALAEFLQHPDPPSELVNQLLVACFQAGRFADIRVLQRHFDASDPLAAKLSLASAYRLGHWQQVCDFSQHWLPVYLDFDLLRMVIRAALEIGLFHRLDPLFAALQPATEQHCQQARLLRLWRACSEGVATHAEAEELLGLMPNLEPAEIACLLRFWPQLLALLGASATSPPAPVQRVLRRCWKRLGLPAIVATAAAPLPPVPQPQDAWRVGLVLAGEHQPALKRWRTLQRGLSQLLPALELVPILLDCDASGESQTTAPGACLDLSAQSPLQRLEQLRKQQFDILLDTVGVDDSLWLLTLAQGVAPLQLAWMASPVSLPGTAPYHAQLADRWTIPNEPAAPGVPWFSLTGVRQLADLAGGAIASAPANDAEVGLVVIGSPATLLPGAAQLLRRCLTELPIQSLWFEHRHWHEVEQLQRWWAAWLQEPLPSACRAWRKPDAVGQRLIGLDLNAISPTQAAAALLSEGLPVLTLPTDSPASRGTTSLLAALGLQSLVVEQPEQWLEAAGLLVSDPALHGQISAHLRDQFETSLLCDVGLLAKDFVDGIRILRSAENRAL